MAHALINWCAHTFRKSTVAKRWGISTSIYYHLVHCFINFICCYRRLIIKPKICQTQKKGVHAMLWSIIRYGRIRQNIGEKKMALSKYCLLQVLNHPLLPNALNWSNNWHNLWSIKGHKFCTHRLSLFHENFPSSHWLVHVSENEWVTMAPMVCISINMRSYLTWLHVK